MTLPAEILAKEDVRNGHIDRTLSYPLEDLDVDGQPGGQVGQEIYGAGAAFVFATRSFHEVSRPFGCNMGSGIHSRPKQNLNENSIGRRTDLEEARDTGSSALGHGTASP